MTKTYSIAALILYALIAPLSGGEFYERFLTLTDTNLQRPIRMLSPLLTDTNNTGNKITNSVLDLRSLTQIGGVADLRLGMTMDDAVSVLGRPKAGWPAPFGCLHGLTTFFYSDVALGFDGDCLETIRINPHGRLTASLTVESAIGEFIGILGAPTGRDNSQLVYHSARANLRLEFHKQLYFIWLERSPSRIHLRNKPNSSSAPPERSQ